MTIKENINLFQGRSDPTLCIISGLPPSNISSELQAFIDKKFAVVTGIEDEVYIEGKSTKNWRYGAVIITSDNVAVINSYKRISDKILSYENMEELSKNYSSWANE